MTIMMKYDKNSEDGKDDKDYNINSDKFSGYVIDN